MSAGFIVTSRFGNAPKQSSSACIVPQIATDLNLLQIHFKNENFDFNKTSIYIIYNGPVAYQFVQYVLWRYRFVFEGFNRFLSV